MGGMLLSYESLIDIDKRNNTAVILEKYFWDMHGVKEYASIVDIPPAVYKKSDLPDISQLNTIIPTKLFPIKDFIVNAKKYTKINQEIFPSALYDLHPIIDLIIAYDVAEILDAHRTYDSVDELNAVWLKILTRHQKEQMSITQSEEKTKLTGIDTSGLFVGMVVKNYKQLCEILKKETKTGNARKAQLKEFGRYFDWEKAGQKFIITDIYDTPLEKEDKRKFGNNSIYVRYIEVILLKYLSQQTGYTRTLTKRKWWELLGIVNSKYSRVSSKELEDLDYSVTAWEIKNFYQRCNKKLEEILFSALNSLKSRKLITYEIQTIIVKRDDKGREIYSEANDNEKKMLLDVEHYVLHNIFECDKMIQIFLKFQQKDYYNKVNELLYEYYGWDHCFKQIKIIYTPDGVRQVYPELEAKLQQELSLMLNEEVCNAINQNAKDTYQKWIDDHKKWEQSCWRDILNSDGKRTSRAKEPFHVQVPRDIYLDAQNILKDELIKIGHSKMTFSSEEFLESNEELNTLFDFEK